MWHHNATAQRAAVEMHAEERIEYPLSSDND
jgi:hypothetical protein